MPGIKRLIPRSIATIAVAAVALALLPSPAAADHTTKVEKEVGNICGYSQDKYSYDSNGDIIEDSDGNPIPGKKYLMKYKDKNGVKVCADNTDGAGGTARPLTGSTTSASTIAGIYGAHGSRTGRTLVNWCVNKMFESAARVDYTGTTNYDDDTQPNYVDPSGTSSNEFTFRTGGGQNNPTYTTWKSDARVLDFDDLVAGARFCSSGQL